MIKLLKFKRILRKILEYNLFVLVLLFVTLGIFLSGCKNDQNKVNQFRFKNLYYQINKHVYFSVREGIYEKRKITFNSMKLVFENGFTYIEQGYVDLADLIIYPEGNLNLYTPDFEIKIKREAMIDLKRAIIQGYDVHIISTKKKDKLTKAYKIKIDLYNNQIHTFFNKGIL
ncbi:MAG: hypothetical protein ABDH21_05905 [bacterium]